MLSLTAFRLRRAVLEAYDRTSCFPDRPDRPKVSSDLQIRRFVCMR